MKQIMTIFAYTFKEGIRKKAFWVSSVIIAALILLLCLAPRILSAFQKDEKEAQEQTQEVQADTEKTGICYFMDETGIFSENIPLFQALAPELDFQVLASDGGDTAAQLEKIRKDIKENQGNAAVIIEDSGATPSVRVINASFMHQGISMNAVLETCNTIWQTKVLTDEGLNSDAIMKAQTVLAGEEETVGNLDLTGYVMGLVLTFVMFFAVYYYGYGVAMSVASEKTSRVMETLIISAKPSRILVGKCLAMGVVGLVQIGGLLIVGILGYTFLVPDGAQIAGFELSFSNFTAGTAAALLLYFILGYAFYAVLNSVCGAAVSKVEDLNSAMMPVSVVAILGFYLGYFTSVAGGGSNLLAKLALYLPISSPFTVPFRLLTGDMNNSDLGISMGILAVSIAAVSMISAKIYSASVMHYGKKLKWKEIAGMK